MISVLRGTVSCGCVTAFIDLREIIIIIVRLMGRTASTSAKWKMDINFGRITDLIYWIQKKRASSMSRPHHKLTKLSDQTSASDRTTIRVHTKIVITFYGFHAIWIDVRAMLNASSIRWYENGKWKNYRRRKRGENMNWKVWDDKTRTDDPTNSFDLRNIYWSLLLTIYICRYSQNSTRSCSRTKGKNHVLLNDDAVLLLLTFSQIILYYILPPYTCCRTLWK